MRDALRRLPLERALHVALPVAVLAFVAGSSSLAELREVGRPGRWLALVALFALAALLALARGSDLRPRLAPFAAAGLFLALAFLSATWSVDAGLTIGRAASLGILFATAALLAFALAGRPAAVAGMLAALAAGAALAALAGLAVLAWRPDAAVTDATVEVPARFQGVGGNPNTVSMLLALALPAGLLALVRARTRARRVATAAAFALLVGSIVASGSRGALLGGTAALLVLAAAGFRGRDRLAAAGAVLAGSVLALAATQIAQPLDRAPEVAGGGAGGDTRLPRYLDAELYRRRVDDIGHPPFRQTGLVVRRTLFGTSGRAQAWGGALEQAADRPIAGYGFGTEGDVFVDRYVAFQGALPENAYIGLVLQLGIAGLLCFLLVPGLLAADVVRSLRRLDAEARLVAAACMAVLGGALVLALAQSAIYSVGNVATALTWIAAFLAAAVAAPAPAPAPGR